MKAKGILLHDSILIHVLRFNPQRGRSWGISFDKFIIKQHQRFSRSKAWGHINKAWKTMVEGTYQTPLPPEPSWNCFTQTFWLSSEVEFVDNGVPYARVDELYCKGFHCVDHIWDSENCIFLSWDAMQVKIYPYSNGGGGLDHPRENSNVKLPKARRVLGWVTFLALEFWCILPPMIHPILGGEGGGASR